MAKPGTNNESWGIPGVYLTGPFAGAQQRQVVVPAPIANEGHRPGSAFPTAAEYWNYWCWTVGELTRWVFDGTSLDDPTAHIVETDANGWINVQRVRAESTNQPLLSAFQGGAADTGTPAFEATTGDITAVGFKHNDAGNQGIAAQLHANSIGVATTIFNTGAGVGLQVYSAGNYAIEATSGGAAAAGFFDGLGIHPGVEATSGFDAAGAAVDALATHPDAAAIRGQTHAAATSAGEAVLAEGFGAGIGVRATATNGYALELSTGGALSSLRFVPKVGDAAGALDGDMDYNSARDQFRVERGSRRDSLWSTPGGSSNGHTYIPRVPGLFNGVLNVLAIVGMTGIDAPQQAGVTVWIDLTFTVEYVGAGGFPNFQLFIDDTTGVPIPIYPPPPAPTIAMAIPALPPAEATTYNVRVPYVVPAAGNRQFTASVNGGPGTLDAVAISFTVLGSF